MNYFYVGLISGKFSKANTYIIIGTVGAVCTSDS